MCNGKPEDLMDVQIPHAAVSGTDASTNTQSASRLAQGGIRRESTGSGKSFSSELYDAHDAKKSRHEIGRNQTRRSQADHEQIEATTSFDEPASESTVLSAASRAKDGHACEQNDEPVQHESNTVTPSVVNDVATQSVLLALIAQPVVKSDTQSLMQASSAEQMNTAMESVMPPVMEDGTSLPVTAADSSKLPQADNPVMSAESAVFPESGEVLLSAANPKGLPISSPDEETFLNRVSQPTPEELRDIQQEKSTFAIKNEEQPHYPMKMEANPQAVALPNDQRPEVTNHQEFAKTLTSEQAQRTDDHRPVVTERPVPLRDAHEPQEDVAPNHLSITSTARQDFTNQDHEGGMEWSGRDHRERPSADQVMAHSSMTEVSAPATPSNPALLVNGMDQRAFSSAPSGTLSAEAHPAASVPPPPVQPTDWMPGDSAGQTKSMVLELSQADLGRVNIRVAVNQDIVHAHFSSDRSDMGHYLQNGQDKLQSALQMSGLDLGRFQVDIDRQSAGRSFQQSASQEHSNGHSPQGESHNTGQGREEFTHDTTPRRGMLNLVA